MMEPLAREAADPRDTCSGCFGRGPCVDPARHGRAMGPIEKELRTLAPTEPCDILTWLWGHEPHRLGSASSEAMQLVSHAGGALCLNPGHSISEADDDGLLRELMSEAIEAAEALGL